MVEERKTPYFNYQFSLLEVYDLTETVEKTAILLEQITSKPNS
jgi:hypothetical protein